MKKLLITVLFILVASQSWGADYYIDPSYGSGGDGSYTTPYDSPEDVTPVAGDNVYLKCGQTFTATSNIHYSNNGTSESKILFGAYYLSGTPVHEEDSPSMGYTCGNDDAKPIWIRNSTAAGTEPISIDGDYYVLNSIQFRAGEKSVRIIGDHVELAYCVVGAGASFAGVNVVDGDYPYIHHTISDQATSSCGDVSAGEGIVFTTSGGGFVDYGVIEYNIIDSWHHTGIDLYHARYTETRYNQVTNDEECGGRAYATLYDSNNNLAHHNLFENQGDGIEIFGYQNEYYYNISNDYCNTSYCDITQGSSDGSWQLSLYASSIEPDCYENKIYNNVFYSSRDKVWGIHIYAQSGSYSGSLEDNEFINNIVVWNASTTDTYRDRALYIVDGSDNDIFYNNTTHALTGNPNIFRNNIWYHTAAGGAVDVLDHETPAVSIASWISSSVDTESDTLNVDPGFNDASNGDFTLTQSSNSIDAGYNLGSSYDAAWLPSSNNPPSAVTTGDQDSYGSGWERGPYVYSSGLISIDHVFPSGTQDCDTDPAQISTGVHIITPAMYCRWSPNAGDTTYASMSAHPMTYNQGGTGDHAFLASVACGSTGYFNMRCNTAEDGSGTDSELVTQHPVVVAAGATESQPSTTGSGSANRR